MNQGNGQNQNNVHMNSQVVGMSPVQPPVNTNQNIQMHSQPVNNGQTIQQPVNFNTNNTVNTQVARPVQAAPNVQVQPAIQPSTISPQPMPTQTVEPSKVVVPTPSVQQEPKPVETPVVEPTQNVIVTNKKKTSNVVLFIVVVIIGLFIYYLNDILAYFNQNFTPVIENETSENGSSNLIGGYIKVDDTNSYIKLKGIRFYNVKKSTGNTIFISYVSDKNYSSSVPLNILIELYDSNKTKIYGEQFDVHGSIESSKTRQYKLSLDEKIYNNALYALVKVGE